MATGSRTLNEWRVVSSMSQIVEVQTTHRNFPAFEVTSWKVLTWSGTSDCCPPHQIWCLPPKYVADEFKTFSTTKCHSNCLPSVPLQFIRCKLIKTKFPSCVSHRCVRFVRRSCDTKSASPRIYQVSLWEFPFNYRLRHEICVSRICRKASRQRWVDRLCASVVRNSIKFHHLSMAALMSLHIHQPIHETQLRMTLLCLPMNGVASNKSFSFYCFP